MDGYWTWHLSALVAGGLLILIVLWDAFEAIVFPRRVSRKLRLTRAFYRASWQPWRALGRRRPAGRGREAFLSVYGPMSLLLLLVIWAGALVLGFAVLHWGAGSRLRASEIGGLVADLYYSGTTFFTLGLGDISPRSTAERLITVVEAGTGFGFLALVIGYLPTLAQAFSRRETKVALLDARAGSPPSATELLARHAQPAGAAALVQLLHDWEQWSSELLETHISFPVLLYYRSQHDNQSWVAALTTILDVCALIIAGLEGGPVLSARLTFAMARHAAGDLAIMIGRNDTDADAPDRLPDAELARLRQALTTAGLTLPVGADIDERLHRLRRMYEPYMGALGAFLLMPLPSWVRSEGTRDNWQSMV